VAKKKTIKITMTVEAELPSRDIIDPETIDKDLITELVKVKSGPYENRFYGELTSVTVTQDK